jgi:hypothetical protein
MEKDGSTRNNSRRAFFEQSGLLAAAAVLASSGAALGDTKVPEADLGKLIHEAALEDRKHSSRHAGGSVQMLEWV